MRISFPGLFHRSDPEESRALSSHSNSVLGIFGEFGQDRPESRQRSDALNEGIRLANAGNWQQAELIFRSERKKYPDYHAPYLWLADCLKRSGKPAKALHLLTQAAAECPRKSGLLEEATELALMELGELSKAVHLFVQSIGAHDGKPASDDVVYQRACLFMGEVFAVFDDTIGARWAAAMQCATEFEREFTQRIRYRIRTASDRDRALVADELPTIRDYLCERFPEGSESPTHRRRERGIRGGRE